MILVKFGFRHLKIKSFSAAELNLSEFENDQVLEIQLRQMYFHVFFIPFFGTHKFWVIKKTDQSLQHVNPDVEQKLAGRKATFRAPLKTYSFPIGLAVLFFILGLIIFILGIHKATTPPWSGKKLFENNIADINKKLNSPAINDYYHLEKNRDQSVILKVDSITKDAVHLIAYDSLKNNEKLFSYAEDLLPYLQKSGKAISSFWIPKQTLRSCIYIGEYDKSTKFHGNKIIEIDSVGLFKLEHIYRMGIPDLIFTSFSENSLKNTISIGIENDGMSCTIEKILPTDKNVEWMIDDFTGKAAPLPYSAEFTKYFYFVGEIKDDDKADYSFDIVGKDSVAHEFIFRIKGKIKTDKVTISKLK